MRAQTKTQVVVGQIFIADMKPFQNAKVTVSLIDAAVQDIEAPVLASVVMHEQSNPVGGYLPFDIYAIVPGGDSWDLAHAQLQASIEIDGKLAYVSTVAHPVNLSNHFLPISTMVVVHPVD